MNEVLVVAQEQDGNAIQLLVLFVLVFCEENNW